MKSRARSTWFAWLAAALYFTALTAVMTYPLITRMGVDLVGEIGDNIYFVWMIGWIKKALFELGVNPFDVWFLNYPEGWNMAYTEITPAQLALALPFALAGGETLGYNAAMLLSFILSGLGMTLWVKRMTGSFSAGLAAGTIFAFLPYRFAHFLIGHLNLSGTQWFPFYFLGLFEVLDSEKKPRWTASLLTGVSLGLLGLTSQYYLYMTLLVTAVIMVVYLVRYRVRWKDAALWRSLVLSGVFALPLVFLSVAPFIALSGQGGLPDRNISIVRPYSASPTDFLLPSTDHFLWGAWVNTQFNREMWVEGTLYIGLVTIVLAALAWKNRARLRAGWILPLLVWGGGFALILALGTDLHWNGRPVEINTPAFLSPWISRETIPLVLPGYFMFQYFPFFAKLRALMRFGVFVLVFFSASAGLGMAWLLEKVSAQRRRLAFAGVILLIFLDFYPGPYTHFAQVQARPVDAWLAAQPGNGAVIQFPFIKGEDQDQTYSTLVHGKPFVGGFFNAFPPNQYVRIRPIMENFPDADSVAMFNELGVAYVLVDSASYPDPALVRERAEDLGLTFVEDVGGQMVFTWQGAAP